MKNILTIKNTWDLLSTGVIESETYKTLPLVQDKTNKKPSAA